MSYVTRQIVTEEDDFGAQIEVLRHNTEIEGQQAVRYQLVVTPPDAPQDLTVLVGDWRLPRTGERT